MDVSVVVVNFNTSNLLRNCLKSILQYTSGIEYEIIVVDNSSTDNSVSVIEEEFPTVKLIVSNQNLGFGRANNLGFDVASGDYVFLLNSDTLLLNNSIFIFWRFMEDNRHRKIGALGGYLLDMNHNYNASYGSFPTFKNEFLYFINVFRKFVGLKTNVLEMVKNMHELSVDYIIGADLFINRKVLEDIGYFDPNFFMYYEETDLQQRMSQNSWERLIIDGPQIIHFEGGNVTSNKLNFTRFSMNVNSYYYYVDKHFTGVYKFFYKLFSLLFRLTLIVDKRYTMNEKLRAMKLTLKAYNKSTIK